MKARLRRYQDANKKSLQLRKRAKAASEYVERLLSSPEFTGEGLLIKYVQRPGLLEN